MEFETWLEESDIERLWAVVHGDLPETATGADEINEFKRLVLHTAMIKMGGDGYLGAVLQ
jgi:hypothetical protein